MNLTPKIELALQVASIAHRGQTRKGSMDIPYMVHPTSVAILAAQVTSDEDTVCAAFLHDVLEDASDTYDAGQMEQEFGPNVTSMVQVVSKDATIIDWRLKNEAYLESIRNTDKEGALIICAADKVNNLTAILRDYDEIGDKLWSRFTAGKKDQLWWYQSVLKVLAARLGDNLLTTRLTNLVQELTKIVA